MDYVNLDIFISQAKIMEWSSQNPAVKSSVDVSSNTIIDCSMEELAIYKGGLRPKDSKFSSLRGLNH